MIYIKISESEIQEAKKLADESPIQIVDHVKYHQKVAGVIGENAVREYLGKPKMEILNYDGGVDFVWNGWKTDVKTMVRKYEPKKDWINNVAAYNFESNCDAFIFTSFNTRSKILTICGWATKERVKKYATLTKQNENKKRDDGSFFKYPLDSYEIKNSQLLTVYR